MPEIRTQDRADLEVSRSLDIIVHLLCCLGLVWRSARQSLSNMLPAAGYPLYVLLHFCDLAL